MLVTLCDVSAARSIKKAKSVLYVSIVCVRERMNKVILFVAWRQVRFLLNRSKFLTNGNRLFWRESMEKNVSEPLFEVGDTAFVPYEGGKHYAARVSLKLPSRTGLLQYLMLIHTSLPETADVILHCVKVCDPL
jgi:hypothetical protein